MLQLILMTLINDVDVSKHNMPAFNFNQLQSQQYAIVNDGVMGGRSNSELTVLSTLR